MRSKTDKKLPLLSRAPRAFCPDRGRAAGLHIALIPLLLVGMLVDPKVITGMNGWIKPLKFAWAVTAAPGQAVIA